MHRAQVAGLTVVATGSEKNHAHLKELGADYTYDYKKSGIEQEIAKAHPADLGLDCFAEGDSTQRLAQCFGSKGGKIVTLLPNNKKDDKWPSNVTAEFTLVCVPSRRRVGSDRVERAQLHHSW
jgi:NADPH:quinone reductase-like Zn-dependent oxidoreductase